MSSGETLAQQAAARKLARDIGSVITVSQRRSDPDADHRQMIARLKEWEKQVWDLLAALQQAQAPQLIAERDAYKRDFEAELAGNARMRERLGARPDETMFAFVDRLEQQLQQAQAPAPAWQPIETAPKDTSVIIGYGPSRDDDDGLPHGVDFMRWYDGCWIDPLTHSLQPTHWMPLPSPPGVAAPPVAGAQEDLLDSLHDVFTRHGIASRSDLPQQLISDIASWAARKYHEAHESSVRWLRSQREVAEERAQAWREKWINDTAIRDERIAALEAALQGTPEAGSPALAEEPRQCWHGHKQRVVGCVSCVIVFDAPADPAPRPRQRRAHDE